MPEVMKVSKVVEVIEVREVVFWKERGMVERMYASPSSAKAMHAAEAMDATKAVHADKAVTSKTAHRAGRQRHGRGKHRHHDSASDCYFAEHDNPPDCHKPPPRQGDNEMKKCSND